MLQGHRLLRTPYANGAHTFLPTVCRRLRRFGLAATQWTINRDFSEYPAGRSHFHSHSVAWRGERLRDIYFPYMVPLAASSVFFIRLTIVIGPTPPGTGVM